MILVIGSSNTDMVIKCEHLPAPGETILGGNFFMNAGGKGANQAVAAARRIAPHLLKIEVECETLSEVEEALTSGADVILLDNMYVDMMRSAVEMIRQRAPHVLIEASGSIGTNTERLIAVAGTGVDFISLGALTHSAPNFDITLELV